MRHHPSPARWGSDSGVPARWCGLSLAVLSLLAGEWGQSVSAGTRSVPNPYSTIAAALSAADPYDTILVAAGTYVENLHAGSKYVTLIGLSGSSATIVDGGNQGSCLKLFNGGNVRGLTFRNGHDPFAGGGVEVRSFSRPGLPFTMEDCVIMNCTAGSIDVGQGGGLSISCFEADVTVRRCRFEGNYAGLTGGGASSRCGGTWEDNVFVGNYAWHTGGGMDGGGEFARRNLFLNNTARNAGGGYHGSPRVLENNTFVENRHENFFSWGAGIHVAYGGSVRKNIVVNSSGLGSAGCGVYYRKRSSDSQGFPAELACNDVWGTNGPDIIVEGDVDTTYSSNISVDPQFCAAAAGDFSLAITSACARRVPICGLIGAFDVGCRAVPVIQTTWSSLKALFR
jgi:hypothetical protein